MTAPCPEPARVIATEEFLEAFPSELVDRVKNAQAETRPKGKITPVGRRSRWPGPLLIRVVRPVMNPFDARISHYFRVALAAATSRLAMTLAVPLGGVALFAWLLPSPPGERETIGVAHKQVALAALSVPFDGLLMSAPPNARAVIQRTLRGYRDALSILDEDALRNLWPGVNVPTLRAAFDALYDQDLQFDACRITVGWASATALCQGSRSYVGASRPRRRRTEARQWQFRLDRRGNDWTITRVAAGAPGDELTPALF